MVRRFLRVPWLTLTAAIWFSTERAHGQLATFQLERHVWTTQLSTNPVGLRADLGATGTGNGLAEVLLRSPKTTNTLEGTTFQRTWSQAFQATNGIDAAEAALNNAFPLGDYSFQVHTTTTQAITGNIIQRDTTYAVTWANGFTTTRPQVTSVPPPASLASSQGIAWNPPGGESAYVSLYVLEGTIDTNLLSALATQGSSVLTNLAVVSTQPKLSSTLGNITLTGLQPGLDHLIWLEFHQTSPESTTAVGTVDSVRSHLSYHRRQTQPEIVVAPVPSVSALGGDISFGVAATGGALRYRWFHGNTEIPNQTTAILTITGVKESDAGDYRVEVSNEIGRVESEPVSLSLASPSDLHIAIGWDGPDGSGGTPLRIDVQGAPNTAYRIDRSVDFRNWTLERNVETDAAGSVSFLVQPTTGPLWFRGVQP